MMMLHGPFLRANIFNPVCRMHCIPSLKMSAFSKARYIGIVLSAAGDASLDSELVRDALSHFHLVLILVLLYTDVDEGLQPGLFNNGFAPAHTYGPLQTPGSMYVLVHTHTS
jgi:hypothetical protein